MSLFVDTSVWSLALRRDGEDSGPEVGRLREAIMGGERIFTTGIVLQELLQGIRGPKHRHQIIERFSALPLLIPDRSDYIDAASLRNECQRQGIQAGTIDALLAQLCIRQQLTMLSTDRDFIHIAELAPLRLWRRY